MDDVERLPLSERPARYRQLADDAERYAASAISPQARDSYLKIANEWRKLAASVEAMLKHR